MRRQLWTACLILFSSAIAIAAAPNLLDSGGISYLQQSGYNTAAAADTDVVSHHGGEYDFLVSISSVIATASTAQDTSTGTGCHKIRVEGVDGDYNYQTELVTLTGTTSVSLTGSYLRINRAYCTETGNLHTNNGDILLGTAPANATSMAVIASSTGRAQMAIYTAPADKFSALEGWSFSVGQLSAVVALQVREHSAAWQTVNVATGDQSSGVVQKLFGSWMRIPKKADVRLRILGVGAGTPRVNGSLEVMEK